MTVETEHETAAATQVPALRREAVLPTSDRGRVATLVAMCSLAGVAVGFGLSTAAMQAASDASRTVVITDVRVQSYDREVRPLATVPWLGITFHTSLDPEANAMVGALVDQVLPATPAEAVGLTAGDVVIAYDRAPVHTSTDLFRRIRDGHVGDQPVLDVLRHGQALTLQPTLGTVPAELVPYLRR